VAKSTLRRKKANKRNVWLVLFVTAIFVVVLSIGIVKAKKERIEIQNNKEKLEDDVNKAKEKSSELEDEKDKELQEKDIIEIAREKFRLIFPNEIIFIPEE